MYCQFKIKKVSSSVPVYTNYIAHCTSVDSSSNYIPRCHCPNFENVVVYKRSFPQDINPGEGVPSAAYESYAFFTEAITPFIDQLNIKLDPDNYLTDQNIRVYLKYKTTPFSYNEIVSTEGIGFRTETDLDELKSFSIWDGNVSLKKDYLDYNTAFNELNYIFIFPEAFTEPVSYSIFASVYNTDTNTLVGYIILQDYYIYVGPVPG